MNAPLTAHQPDGRLTTFDLKIIAVIAMTADHIGWMFVPTASAAGQGMHLIGRITLPVMCFFLTEGYHRTHNLRRYFARLSGFGLIAQFAYAYYQSGSFLWFREGSIIAGLLLSLLCVYIYHGGKERDPADRSDCFGVSGRSAAERIPPALRFPVIALLALAAKKCDWGVATVMFTMTFELARPYGIKMQCRAYLFAAVWYLLPYYYHMAAEPATITEKLFVTGVLLPALLLRFYNGKKGGGKYSRSFKWFFYVYYPVHLVLIRLIAERIAAKG